MKSGFIAVLGRPNAGKSSLMNLIVGEKVSIVSPKPQTTRSKIRGILTTDSCQFVFLDTPGSVKPRNRLQEYMARDINEAAREVDVLLYVVDGEHGVQRQDMEEIESYAEKGLPLVVAYNKIDLISYAKMLPELDKLNAVQAISAVVPISARSGKNKQELIKVLEQYMVDGPLYFSSDDITDQSLRTMCAEIVREKALWYLNDEVPHGVGVAIADYRVANVVEIDAELYVERDSHKAIVIGKGGATLKKIGTAARGDIERLVGSKVMLKIFVKVREDWRNNVLIMNDVGYKKP